MKRPLIWIALLWCSGIAAAMVDNQATLATILLTLVFILAVAVKSGQLTGKGFMICLIIGLVSTGYHHWIDHRNVTKLKSAEGMALESGTAISLRGAIASPVQIDGDRVSFRMKAASWQYSSPGQSDSGPWQPAHGEMLQISLRVLSQSEQKRASRWKIGDRAEFSGTLAEPSGPRNFGDFDYRSYLYDRHIHWTISLKGLDAIQVTPDRWNRYTAQRWTEQLRQQLAGLINRMYKPVSAGLMNSLLIGVVNDLDPDQTDQFSKIGLTHLLSISGLHVGIFLLCCMGLMRLCGVPRETNLLIAMIIIPFFILITGASPPVLRSGLMAWIALQAARLNRLKDGLNIATAVCLLMLLWNPYYMFNVSFQLSFLVTVGLIVGVPPVSRLLPIASGKAKALVSVTIVAEFVSFPLSAYYFNQFSLLSWLANLLLVPVFEMIIIPLGYLSLVLSIFYLPAGMWISPFNQWVLSWDLRGIEWLNRFDAMRLVWPQPSISWIIVYYLLIALLLRSWLWWKSSSVLPQGMYPAIQRDAAVVDEKERTAMIQSIWSDNGQLHPNGSRTSRERGLSRKYATLTGATLAGFICLLLLYGYEPNVWNHNGQIDFIDVGQGDCILIRTPTGATLLVDGGGTLSFGKPAEEWSKRKDPYEVGRKLLVPVLKRRGVHHINYLIATHEDADHIGGLREVLKQIPVDRLIFNGTLKQNDMASELFRTALDRNIPLYTVAFGQQLQVDKATELSFLYPLSAQENRMVEGEGQNENCIVFVLKMWNSTFLFTGDIGSKEEGHIMELLHDNPDYAEYVKPKVVDVLKVAHHGSKTSTSDSWLRYWQPRQAVISVGANNVYGHPTDQVLERLTERDIPILRTDLDGEIQLKVGRHQLQVRHVLATPDGY